jgi:hypothetical protein
MMTAEAPVEATISTWLPPGIDLLTPKTINIATRLPRIATVRSSTVTGRGSAPSQRSSAVMRLGWGGATEGSEAMPNSASRQKKIRHAPSIYRPQDLKQAITRRQRQMSVPPTG